MNKYTVWTWPYNNRYYLTHPWYWFKHLWRNIRDAYRRARYGWCPGDVWDWDHWFANVVPPMLRYMADHGSAYPGTEPFEDPEDWHKWLHHMADLIESSTENWRDEHNEYYEEFMKHIMDGWKNMKEGAITRERTELDDKYYARMRELEAESAANIKEAFAQMGEHFFSLWD